MPRTALSISVLILLFAGTSATLFANTHFEHTVPRNVSQAIPAGDTRLGIDCGLGTAQAVDNGTGFPVAPSENNPASAAAQSSCTWIGDAGQTLTGTNDGTTEPLVTDQDEILSQSSPSIGGGFTANVIILQNRTASVNGFDLQLIWNSTILRAVEFDQTNIPVWTPNVLLTLVKTIDNTSGVARLAEVVSNPVAGNFTLFRIRFDVVGVGVSQLHIVDENAGLASPGPVVHSIIDGAFDSETFFDPGHTINWSASFTNSSPIRPGLPSTFVATVSGGTTPYTFGWQFNSCNQISGTACSFRPEATGNPVTITMPTTAPGFRVDLEVNDSASHSIHLVRAVPFTAGSLRDSTSPSNTFSVNTAQTFSAIWLGGVPPYTESLRFCPGVGTTSSIICTLPNPTIIDSTPTQIMSENVTYKLSGVYTNTLSLTDSRGSYAGGSNTASLSSAVNVTGGAQAYNVVVSETPTSAPPTAPVSITAKIVYATGYPTTFESAAFSYSIAFGDGATTNAVGTTSFTIGHSYSTSGNYTVRVTARESSPRAISQIEETGYSSIIVQPSTGFNYMLSVNPIQGRISSGGSVLALVNVTAAGGTPETVGLQAIYSIAGVTIAFSPTSSTPSYSSTMTVTSQTSTPDGVYTITIVGNSTSGIVRQTTFMLLVGQRSSPSTVIGVFSAHYGSANFTDTSLVAGSKFYVQVNVTNAPSSGWNGYEFALFYDQRYINVTSYDIVTNTVFPATYIAPGTYNSPGALRLSIVNLGVVTTTMGMLVNITFTVVKSGGVSPLMLAPGTAEVGQDAGEPPAVCPACPASSPNWSRLLAGNNLVDVATTNGYFNNAGGNPGPVASFTYSPANPLQGQTITFNATSSYDPDNSGALNHGILEYLWDFGTITSNGNETTFSPIITHAFSSFGTLRSSLIGNFTVRLTVIDSDNGFEGMATHFLTISPNLSDEHPIASFSYAPSNPVTLSTVTFNGTASFDPDGTITTYYWNFGDGGSSSPYPFPQHFYDLPGNYTVTLTVTDTDSQTASASMIIHVMPRPPHDVTLTTLYASPSVIVSGQKVNFILEIGNTGTLDSTVNATVYYNGKIATSRTNIVIPGGTTFSYYYDLSWATAGVAAGNYTISATVFLAGDPTPSDNSLTDGQLTVLPPPVLTATPGDGPVGTTVTLHGSGFLSPYYGFTNEFEITFDNQFIGYSFASTSFNFTFNVPPAQAGPHFIHAVELYPSLDVQTSFTVTLTPSSVSVIVTTGTIYFPGDTATIFVQTSLNGTPTTVTSIQAILVKPGNTNTTLTLALLTTGIYKATYNIPTTGPIGTYTIIIKTHQTGANDGQSLTTFEVKLSWLASQGRNITIGIAITGLVGVAAVAWRKGYFRQKDNGEETDGTISDTFTSP